jgi:putative ABC transport system permease protein
MGSVVATNLFGEDVDPTGQIIRIKNQPFKVIGVMTSKVRHRVRRPGRQGVRAPRRRKKKLMGIQHIQNITVSAVSASDVKATAEPHGTPAHAPQDHAGDAGDFMVRTLEEMAAMRTETTRR